MNVGEPPAITTSTRLQKLRGIPFALIMLGSALFGSVFILLPLVPLIFLRPRLYRQLVDKIVGFWLVLPAGFMEFIFGANFTVTGDIIDGATPALIVMNHRTRLDWLFFWNALYRIDPWLLTSEKISLKSILKYVPGAGWAMGSNAYMFLDRNFENDKANINQLLQYYVRVGNNYQILLFPEGTDKSVQTSNRSKAFAEANNLPMYDYVLHPRTTGFTHLLQKMRQEKYIDYIYDVTVAFNDAIVQSEVDLVKLGVTPKDVRFHVKKIPIAEIPESEEEAGQWLRTLWAEKEQFLRKFYSQPASSRQLQPGSKVFDLTLRNQICQGLILSMWVIMTIVWTWLLLTSTTALIMSGVTILFYVGAQKYYKGFEMFISSVGLDDYQHRLGLDSPIEINSNERRKTE